MNQFEQCLAELKTAADNKKTSHERLEQALNQGLYTINPKLIASQWLKQSFCLSREACLQD